MEKISCYISFYNDLDFLEDILDGINNYMNEIVIIDGPYEYCVEKLKNFNLYYDENSKPEKLTIILDKYKDKVKYYYSHWKDEKEKRIFGYDKCTNEIVILVDSDEFYYIENDKLQNFILDSKYAVAGFKIYNMSRHNTYFELAHKNIVFKKSKINSYQHLSYTWLVGVDDKEPQKIGLISNNFIGTIYHQTLNRSKYGNIIKYIFYISLYNYKNKLALNKLIGHYDIGQLSENLTLSEIHTIFSKSMIELINLPNITKKIYILDNPLINLDKYKDNFRHGYFSPNTKILKNIITYMYLDEQLIIDDELNILIETDNIINLNLNLIEINVNNNHYEHKDICINVVNNLSSVNIKLNNNNCLNYVIKLKCDTYNGIVGNIKNIGCSIKNKFIKTVIPFGEECYVCQSIDVKFNSTDKHRIGFPFDYVGHPFIDTILKKLQNYSPLKKEDLCYRPLTNKPDSYYYILDEKYDLLYWHDETHPTNEFSDDKINKFIEKYNNRYDRMLSYINSNNPVIIFTVQHFDKIYVNTDRKDLLISLYNYLEKSNPYLYVVAINYYDYSFKSNRLIHHKINYLKTENFQESKNNFMKELYKYVNIIC